VSRYTVYVIPPAWQEIKNLPGNLRQRVKRAIDALAENPHPSKSKKLDISDLADFEAELYRLRLDRWRIVYAITESEKTIDVLAVRKRPPYDYKDLEKLIEEVA
jgi:mRNA interferase RelE/StbE